MAGDGIVNIVLHRRATAGPVEMQQIRRASKNLLAPMSLIREEYLVDLRDSFLFLGYHFLRQLCVRQALSELLPAGHHPGQEAFDDFSFSRVLNLPRN